MFKALILCYSPCQHLSGGNPCPTPREPSYTAEYPRDQEREGTSLQTQLEACRAYCREHGYQVVNQWQEAFSGLTLERPKLREMQYVINTQDIDVVVIFCLDRLSRDPTHGVILTQEFDKLGITLEAVTETMDSSELGRLINYIRGFASKLEAEKIMERTTRGKKAILKDCKLPQGTGIGIYGYDWIPEEKHRAVNEAEAKIVRRVFDMVLAGRTAHQIAIQLNADNIPSKSGARWSSWTIKHLIANECYMGKTYYGQRKRVSKTKWVFAPREQWIELPDVTPAIITEDNFKKAQDALVATRSRRPLKPKAAYLLTGFIKCAKCGSPVGGTTLNGKYRYYKCRGTAPTYTRGIICKCAYMRADELERQVWQLLVRMFTSPETVICTLLTMGYRSKDDVLPVIEESLSKLRLTVKACEKREQELYPVLSNEGYNHDLVLDALNKVKAKKEDTIKQMVELEAEKLNASIAKKVTLKLTEIARQSYHELLDEPSFERKRELFDALNVQVLAEPGSFKFTCLIDTELTSEDFDEERDLLFRGALKEFEEQHPEYSFEDLYDYDKTLPSDSLVGRVINQVKQNLVTIGRTSAL